MRPPLEAGVIRKEREQMPKDISLIFPGQGAQKVGMGNDLYNNSEAARAVYREADGLSDFSVSKLSFEGPKSVLDRADIAPQAIFTASVAAFAALIEKHPDLLERVRFMAGHSLGEYAPLVASGVLNFKDAFGIVKERSVQTKKVAEQVHGAMAVVRTRLEEGVIDLLRSFGVEIAAVNSDEDFTITGLAERVQRVLGFFEEMKIRARLLDIDGSFHSSFMEPAKEALERFLANFHFSPPRVPLFLNVTGQFSTSSEEIKKALSRNLTSTVQWKEAPKSMVANGVACVIEVGPRAGLAGLARKTAPSLRTTTLDTFSAIQNFNLANI